VNAELILALVIATAFAVCGLDARKRDDRPATRTPR
jgi:hypothetical protein